MYPIIELFGRQIGTYGLCALFGLIIAMGFFCHRVSVISYPIDDSILLGINIIIGLVIGSHMLYGIINIGYIIDIFRNIYTMTIGDMAEKFRLCFGGSVYYGGLFGALAALLMLTKKTEESQKLYLRDTFALCVPLFHIFGRIGCFFGGCCYGVESDFGFIVYNNTLVPEINGVKRFPVALAEALGNLIIFLILYVISKKERQSGKLILFYLIMYPVLRFSLEFFRGDTARGIYWGLSTSQWISLGILTISLTLFPRDIIKQKRPRPENGS